ncbi:MAG: sigma-54-dependent Fis family transcriptional regulator [Magnetococcales bacterium]|nr:sigma-54-dependent Fis family transcriptional regulator [Magnetococcales bacterium]
MKPAQHIEMMGDSPAFASVIRAARLVAVTGATVLIQGESGVGKELLAHAIHADSPRAKGTFVAVNCAALTESLVESELFGHAKGAFTGADQERAGRIATAHGGTLFLDEIGDMPLSIQAKLLRFLENGECHTLGRELPKRVDVRVIAATNRDLATLVNEGGFRQDLYYRLQVVPLSLPPLRERGQDVALLANAFLQRFAVRHAVPAPFFSKDALRVMLGHPWPGNIRELRNLCERAVIFHQGQEIGIEFVHAQLALPMPSPRAAAITLPNGGLSLDHLERDLILAALERTQGNRTHAARLLDLTRDTLLYRMKKHALR